MEPIILHLLYMIDDMEPKPLAHLTFFNIKHCTEALQRDIYNMAANMLKRN